jgi:hypothetical protein
VLVYIPHLSSDLDLAGEPLIRELAGNVPAGVPYFCLDLRGMGESQPNTCGPDTFSDPYGCDYMYAIHGLMLDDPLVAQRVHDLLTVFDWLEALGYPKIHLVARGHGSIPAALAALLDRSVVEVRMKHMLRSYADIAEADRSNWPLSAYLPGVLKQFDLPDLRAELEMTTRAAFEDPWGPEDFKFKS